jgi:hypothetical protein
MDDFRRDDNIGGDVPIFNKSSLRVINVVREMMF